MDSYVCKIQAVQNFTACVIRRARKFDHFAPYLAGKINKKYICLYEWNASCYTIYHDKIFIYLFFQVLQHANISSSNVLTPFRISVILQI